MDTSQVVDLGLLHLFRQNFLTISTLDGPSYTLLQLCLLWPCSLISISASSRHKRSNLLGGEQPILWNYLPLAYTIPDVADDAPSLSRRHLYLYMALASILSRSSTCPLRTNLVLRLRVFLSGSDDVKPATSYTFTVYTVFTPPELLFSSFIPSSP